MDKYLTNEHGCSSHSFICGKLSSNDFSSPLVSEEKKKKSYIINNKRLGLGDERNSCSKEQH